MGAILQIAYALEREDIRAKFELPKKGGHGKLWAEFVAAELEPALERFQV